LTLHAGGVSPTDVTNIVDADTPFPATGPALVDGSKGVELFGANAIVRYIMYSKLKLPFSAHVEDILDIEEFKLAPSLAIAGTSILRSRTGKDPHCT